MTLTRRTPLRRSGPISRAPRNAEDRERAALVGRLDDLARDLTFRRDRRRCVRCDSSRRLQWCHAHSRRYLATRWDLLNCMTLCQDCHEWWHNPPRLITVEEWSSPMCPRGDAAYYTADRLLANPLAWWEARVGEAAARRVAERLMRPLRPDLDEVERSLEAMHGR